MLTSTFSTAMTTYAKFWIRIIIANIRKQYHRPMKWLTQGWVANSTPGIYQWHLPVFTGLENTPQVANTGKYWQIEFFFLP